MMTRCADAELEERIRRSEGRDEGRRESTAQIEKLTAEVPRLREALEQVVDAADQHLHCGIADPLAFRDDCRKAIVIARAALGRTTK